MAGSASSPGSSRGSTALTSGLSLGARISLASRLPSQEALAMPSQRTSPRPMPLLSGQLLDTNSPGCDLDMEADHPVAPTATSTLSPVSTSPSREQDKVYEVHVRTVAVTLRLRARLTEAIRTKQNEKFKPLLRNLEDVQMTKEILMETGVGYFVTERSLWPKDLHVHVQRLHERWRLVQRGKKFDMHWRQVQLLPADKRPWVGCKGGRFLMRRSALASWMRAHDSEVVPGEVNQRRPSSCACKEWTLFKVWTV